MKKFLLIVLSIMMVLSFAACGEDKKSDTLKDAQDKLEDASDKLKDAIDSGDVEKDDLDSALDDVNDALDNAGDSVNGNISITDYVAALAEEGKNSASDLISINCIARGNDVVYECTYKVATADNVKDIIDGQMEQLGSTNQTLVNTMKRQCSAVERLVYEYYTMDGELISSYTWEAK